MSLKKLFTSFLLLGIASGVFAQDIAEDYINMVGKVKVIPKMNKQIAPYLAIKFRSGTVSAETARKGRDYRTARAYAVLDGIDGELFQEITDEFYTLFVGKMKEIGIEYLPYEKVQESKNYNSFIEKEQKRDYNHRNFGTSDVYTQNNVPFFKYPTIILKPLKMVTQAGASGFSCHRLTIDFAEFDMSVDIAKSYGEDAYRKWETITTNYSADIIPGIKLTTTFQDGALAQATTGSYFNAPGLYMTSDAGKFLSFTLKRPIYTLFSDYDIKSYDNKTPEFSSKKFRFFGGAMELGTWVITPTREDYKKSAMNALTRYANLIVAAAKAEMK